MLVPAITYKESIEKQFRLLSYSDRLLLYTGSIENYDWEIKTDVDKYDFAIVHSGQVVGYISFRVDWYCSCAYNFGLMKFLNTYFDNTTQEYKSSAPLIISAVREVVQMIKRFNLHRIDFRCVSGNPAMRGYMGILKQVQKQGYSIRTVDFIDNIRDRDGQYRNTTMFELIKREPYGEF